MRHRPGIASVREPTRLRHCGESKNRLFRAVFFLIGAVFLRPDSLASSSLKGQLTVVLAVMAAERWLENHGARLVPTGVLPAASAGAHSPGHSTRSIEGPVQSVRNTTKRELRRRSSPGRLIGGIISSPRFATSSFSSSAKRTAPPPCGFFAPCVLTLDRGEFVRHVAQRHSLVVPLDPPQCRRIDCSSAHQHPWSARKVCPHRSQALCVISAWVGYGQLRQRYRNTNRGEQKRT